MKRKILTLLLSAAMAFALASCGNQEQGADVAASAAESAEMTSAEASQAGADNHEHAAAGKAAEKEDLSDVQLADWNGEWNSMTHYIDNEEVQDAYKEKAEKTGESDLEKVKADYKESVKSDYESMIVDGNTITYYKTPKADGGEVLETVEYEYVTAHPMEHGGQTYHWYEFKAKTEGSAHPTILLMDIHGESVMSHFHMRYGEDAESILSDKDWYPTFFKPDVALSQIAEEIAE